MTVVCLGKVMSITAAIQACLLCCPLRASEGAEGILQPNTSGRKKGKRQREKTYMETGGNGMLVVL